MTQGMDLKPFNSSESKDTFNLVADDLS